jgi:hypothetical protein
MIGLAVRKSASKPTVGRIVHYRTEQGTVLAAMVTQVSEDKVNLVVFADNEHNKQGYPTFLLQGVEQGKKKGQWDWPPREGE